MKEFRNKGQRCRLGSSIFPPLKVIIVFICMYACLCMCVPSCVEVRGQCEGDFEEEASCVGENMKA